MPRTRCRRRARARARRSQPATVAVPHGIAQAGAGRPPVAPFLVAAHPLVPLRHGVGLDHRFDAQRQQRRQVAGDRRRRVGTGPCTSGRYGLAAPVQVLAHRVRQFVAAEGREVADRRLDVGNLPTGQAATAVGGSIRP